jgi:hypothetical protein
MTPAERHDVALAALDERIRIADQPFAVFGEGVVRNPDLDQLEGRRRILERHAPESPAAGRETWCQSCDLRAGRWPCDDYLDAAAGLLPEEAA